MAASVIWDLLAPAYDRLRQSDRKTRESMYRRIRQVIRDRDVLEVGCGTGELACTTAVYARHMAAVDSSMGMLRQAEKKHGPKNLVFRPGDVYELPFGDGVFDVVIIADTLHVLNDPAKALQEISRVLKPGGVLLSGLDTGVNFIVDEAEERIVNRLPFDPVADPEQMEQLRTQDAGVQFSHTLEDQIGGQLRAGFRLTDLYEDTNGEGRLHELNIPSFIATRAVKQNN